MSEEKVESSPTSAQGFSAFLRESVLELKKVHSPTRAETVQATLVTIFIMLFISVVLFLLDVIFKRVMDSLLT